jgi:hypothetical protein
MDILEGGNGPLQLTVAGNDVGPVKGLHHEDGNVALAHQDKEPEEDGNVLPVRVEGRTVGKVLDLEALGHVGLAEAEVDDGDGDPGHQGRSP